MITADPQSKLGYICKVVDRMEPGQCFTIDARELYEAAGSYEHNGVTFTAPDRVLGNIVGSGWTHSYWTHPDGRLVTFKRHHETSKRTHYDPDRRPAPETKKAGSAREDTAG